MSSWRQAWLATFWLLIHIAAVFPTTGNTINDGDFAFDINEDVKVEISNKHNEECTVRRLWGVPDMPAYVGRVFKLKIPNEAFSAKIKKFKASGVEGSLPKWLIIDGHKGVLKGIPEFKDRGEHRIKIVAIPHNSFNVSKDCPLATDIFTIEVKDTNDIPTSGSDVMQQCHSREEETQLKIIIDRPIHKLKPEQKLLAVNNLANFMGLDYTAFIVYPYDSNGKKIENEDVMLSGLGDRTKKNKLETEIRLTVGCAGKLWPKHSILVHQMKEQARDGTISFITHLPIVNWKVVTYKQTTLVRKHRQIEGSASEYHLSDDEDDYSGDDGDYGDDYGEEVEPLTNPVPPMIQLPTLPSIPHHHHRHHHGENFITPPVVEDVVVPEETFAVTDATTTTMTTVSTTDAVTNTPRAFSHKTPSSSMSTAIPEYFVPSSSSEGVSQEMETNTLPFVPVYTLDVSTGAASPTVETSMVESSITLLASPATTTTTQPTEDTATTFFATTVNANVVQTSTEKESTNTVSTLKNDELPTNEENVKSSTPLISSIPPKIVSSPEPSEENKNMITVSDIPSINPTIDNTPTPTNSLGSVLLPINTLTSNDNMYETSTNRESTTIDATTTEKANTIFGRTTETIEFTKPTNNPPQIQHRTKKVPVTAGKYFSYIIPEDLFYDIEDGMNLRLSMYDIEHNPLKSTSWVQFNPQTREVYGLPLEDHVSKWEYIMEATDSKGASVNDTLDITVQQHKGRRTVNHEFSMKLRVTKKYPALVDWQIRALKGLVSLFRDTDMDQITVRHVVLDTDPIEFVWTNDTLPRNDCPKNDIDRLMGILQSNSDGDPSPALLSAMSPDLIVKSVTWRGTGACQGPLSTPAVSLLPNPSDNFNPIPRNQIDQLKIEVGKLLVFKVPEDSFYDPEDGNARNLKMWLTRGDRSTIPLYNWLQFDSKNQEFYGLPLERDRGRKEYQLVCEDKGGLTASDALIVEVFPGNYSNPPVEFRMTIDTPYESFIQSALLKRKFVENLYTLFNDKEYTSIKIKSITERPTIVSWYNTSLLTDRCPDDDIERLKKVLTHDKSLTERVHVIMGNEFSIMSVSFVPTGACATGSFAIPPEPPPNVIPHVPHHEDTTKAFDSKDDYLTTFIIPIVVIICMIFIAVLIACLLYRRRRSGKMSVGDDEERQAFRSKGIPVIFQDELDEKPDPSNKTPVIMKEEKPPLLPPPEYKGVDSSSPTPSHTPYHPPPPFTASSRDNNRNNRPKPTPSYRKPPPYVPP